MNWFLKALKQYADFKGRARRQEYWMFYLFYGLILLTLCIVHIILIETNEIIGNIFLGLLALTVLIFIIPSLAVTVRRLHDIGRSGWWYFIIILPFGGMILFIFTVLDSEYGENQWGKNPKGIGNNDEISKIGR